MGIAGEMLYHSQGAEKMKNSTPGTTTKAPVTRLTGLERVFWNRPPMKKTVLPSKYSKLRPTRSAILSALVLALAFSTVGLSCGVDDTESSFSPPCMSRLPGWLESPLAGSRKLDRKDRGDLMGVGRFPDDL